MRMIFVETEAGELGTLADVVRTAFMGRLSAPAAEAAVGVPAALPSAPAAAIEAPEPVRLPFKFRKSPKVKRAPKSAGGGITAKPAAVAKRVTSEDSVPARCLEIIRKGPPRTTGEIYDVLRKQGFTGTNAAVYQACKFWRDKGLVVSKPDDSAEGGGVVKQYPAE
jgi:hypothetical protein